MGLADRDYLKDLHALLRISRHVSDGELRYAYEQAMSAATRSGDLVRARTLLSAYEQWSRQRGAGVFGRTFTNPNAPAATPARRAKSARRPRGCGLSLPTRVLSVLIAVPMAVLTAIAWIRHPPTDGTTAPVATQAQATYASPSPPRPDGPRAARADLHEAVAAIAICRRHGGRLPHATGMQHGRAVLTCGRKLVIVPLHRGDGLELTRTGRRAYRVTVVTRGGGAAEYDSRTRTFR